MIAIRRQPARETQMPALSERLANPCAAQACLRSTARVNFHEYAPGALSLVREHKKKVGPPSVVDGLSEHSRREAFHVQIFDCNQAVLIDDLARFFVMKVAALVANVIMESLKQQDGFAPAIRSFLTSRNAPLQVSKLALCGSKPAWILNCRSVAERDELTQSDINTYGVRTEGQRRGFTLNRKNSKPTIRLSFDRQSFYGPGKWAVQLNSNLTDLGQPQSVSGQRIADFSKCHAVVSTCRSKSRIPRLVSCLNPSKEAVKGQLNALQNVFQGLRIQGSEVFADLLNCCQLQILIEPRDRLAFQPPSIAPFLNSGIVKFATERKLSVKDLLLTFCGIDSIAKSRDHKSSILPFKFSGNPTEQKA